MELIQVPVFHKTLFDSPYDKTKENSFEFDFVQVNTLTNEIVFANPSCYLVSGYRGAGKTSFAMKVEEMVKQKCEDAAKNRKNEASLKSDYELRFSIDKAGNEYIKEENYEIVFVHLNFSKYDKETYLLRHLIRETCQEVEKVFVKWASEIIDKKSDKIDSLKTERQRINELFQRTFLDVKTQIAWKLEKTRSLDVSTELNIKDIIDKISGKLLLALSPLIIPLTDSINLLLNYWHPPAWLRAITWILCIVGSVVWILSQRRTSNPHFLPVRMKVEHPWLKKSMMMI